MKIIEGFRLREVAGEMIVSGEGVKQINFNKLISLNSTAAFLWQKIEGKEFSAQNLADLLVEEYEIDPDDALRDATKVAQQWKQAGIIED